MAIGAWLLKALCLVLPELPAHNQMRLQVSLGLKDAETIGRSVQGQAKYENSGSIVKG